MYSKKAAALKERDLKRGWGITAARMSNNPTIESFAALLFIARR